MGGYASGIGGMVAKIFFIPLIIHEQNAIPGTTNKLLGKFAQQSLQAFDNTFDLSINAVTVGNPILFTPEPKNTPELVNNLLVLGGSLGAQKINETITSIKTPLNIWHQTGVKHLESVKLAYQNNPNTNLCIESFIENMAEAYAWADVVVCRSGAMTVSELVATKTIAILVPFPYAVDNHQTKNAQYLSDQGAGILLEESLLNAEAIDMQLRSLTTNKLKDMTSALESLQIPSPEKMIVDYILIPNRSKSS
jgi:UDP-N-acetylglucosamine--N-acetylmuramyl-(pentapeptide) pyrophosphoryl-undecaprenol N-acetylglucosamine transferase